MKTSATIRRFNKLFLRVVALAFVGVAVFLWGLDGIMFLLGEGGREYGVARTVRSTRQDIVELYVEGKGGRTTFRLVEAYLRRVVNLSGGLQDGVYIAASMSEGLIPWTLKSSETPNPIRDITYINLGPGYQLGTKNKVIPGYLRPQVSSPVGVYRGVFDRFDGIIGINFYLLPHEQPQNPIVLVCRDCQNFCVCEPY